MAARPVLHYFPIRGRAEVLRILLAAAGEEFETVDVVYTEQKTDRSKYPFGQCPRLVDGDIDICQSNAIARYLARKYKLMGSSDKDVCTVDMILEGVESLRVKYTNLIYNDKLEEGAKDTYWRTYFDKGSTEGRNGGAHVQYLLNFLVKNAPSKFIVGEGLTVADVAVWDILDLHMRIFADQLKDTYPELVEYHAHIAELPGIKEYLVSPKRLAAPNANNLG